MERFADSSYLSGLGAVCGPRHRLRDHWQHLPEPRRTGVRRRLTWVSCLTSSTGAEGCAQPPAAHRVNRAQSSWSDPPAVRVRAGGLAGAFGPDRLATGQVRLDAPAVREGSHQEEATAGLCVRGRSAVRRR